MTGSDARTPAQAQDIARNEWRGAAPGWRKLDTQLMAWAAPLTDVMLELIQLRPGMQVLDLASGTGEPALTLAAAVGPQGQVTATDLVPEMLATAEEKARARGLANITFQQAAAEDLPFPDQHFDLVTCRCGVMLFPNPGQALQASYRVLKPGGRAVFVAWGPVEQNGFFAAMTGPFVKRGLMPPPPPGAVNQFQFAQPGTLAAALEAAGFQHVDESARRVTMAWPGSVDAWIEGMPELSPTFKRIMEKVSQEQLQEALGEVRAVAQQYHDGERVNFPAPIVVATGVR